MEMSERNRAPDNSYEGVPQDNQENEYQTLHFSERVKNRAAEVLGHRYSQKKFILLLLPINALLLTIILVLVALNYSQFSRMEPRTDHMTDADPEAEEVWHLHDDEFYLIWRNRGTCEDAEAFCSERGAHLATVDDSNEEWMRSQARGEALWVKRTAHASGSGATAISDIEFDYNDNLHNDSLDQEDCECELFPDHYTSDNCKDLHNWACQSTKIH
ncbi:uncharacterized protein LOC108918660 [Scleropages formosus]|uniref:uncharacterized protein LOC108918660 n=1 Tax=Scleropages formosus TaxID=113540 RepID=UPI0008782A30|nr:uncharacterized protein LOC108918660 [Scleropages formosus]